MRAIVGLNQIIDLNKRLEEKKLKFKIHLHDACGGQGFSIEELEKVTESDYSLMSEEVCKYFEENRMAIEFSKNKKSFWLS